MSGTRRKGPHIARNCVYCGSPVSPQRRNDSKYCGPACGQKARARANYLKNTVVYKARAKAWRAANLERANALMKARRSRNPEERRKEHRRRAAKYPGRATVEAMAYRERNPEWWKAWCRARYERIKAANPEILRQQRRESARRHPESAARRRAARLRAIPAWLTSEQHAEIAVLYRAAKAATVDTGVLHVVDHVVPLLGKTVCGLHVPWNLQVLTGSENARKINRIVEFAMEET